MTSRILQISLSPILIRVRSRFSCRLRTGQPTSSSSSNSTRDKMPVIHAVAAHRHCHNLCQQPHVVPLSNGLIYVNTCKSEFTTTRRSMSLVTRNPPEEASLYESNRNHHPAAVKPILATSPATWLKARSKSLFAGSKSMLGFNLSGIRSSLCEEDLSESRRSYSKTKDKGIKKKSVVILNEDEMNEVINASSLKSQLESTLNQMKDEYASQLSIRGAAGALELLEVEFEGEKYPLQELAQIGRKNPQLAVLNLASLPDACQPVMKAIQESGMQLNPQQEGTTIYIPLPKVTREHRENLAKNAKVIFTKYKTSLQHVQNKFIKQCKSHKDASEDVVFSVSQQIMRMTEMYIADAEKVMHNKQTELLDTVS